jgi:hypothetical protein
MVNELYFKLGARESVGNELAKTARHCQMADEGH